MKLSVQEVAKLICKSYDQGHITKNDFVQEFNRLATRITNKKVLKRADNRSFGEYALNIFEDNRNERRLIERLKTSLIRNRIYSNVLIEDNGVGNHGIPFLDETQVTDDADFILTCFPVNPSAPHLTNGPFPVMMRVPVEVKRAPNRNKLTFKYRALSEYERTNTYLVLFVGTEYTVIAPQKLMYFLNLPVKNYREIGHKPGVQAGADQIGRWLKFSTL